MNTIRKTLIVILSSMLLHACTTVQTTTTVINKKGEKVVTVERKKFLKPEVTRGILLISTLAFTTKLDGGTGVLFTSVANYDLKKREIQQRDKFPKNSKVTKDYGDKPRPSRNSNLNDESRT